jgi:undecaprenyl-diphosphatase
VAFRVLGRPWYWCGHFFPPVSPLVEVLFLGVLQGITEFLPVSSDGHLALGQMLFGVDDPSLTLSVLLHAGTLLATLVVLRQRVFEVLGALVRGVRTPSMLTSTSAGRDALFVLVATIPTGIIGLLARDAVARWTASPLVIALGFFMTSGVLLSSRWAPGGTERHPTLGQAVLVGIIQGVAVLPGVSRSGSTIGAALWMGVRPDRAFELSMLMSLPAVAGAVLLELTHVPSDGSLGLFALGAFVAFVVGLVALWALRQTVSRGYFSYYALWVFPLAMATLALAWAWPVKPLP